jgi:hypothetical protein
LRNTPDRRIRRQSKACTQLIVRQLLQLHLIGALLLESNTRQPRCRLIEALNRYAQGISLGRIGQKLELHGDFHTKEYIGILSQCQMPTVLAQGIEPHRLNLSFPCQLKQTAPRKESLWHACQRGHSGGVTNLKED